MKIGPSDDESYFWLWSNHPALSYYDHPPIIAYLIKASTIIFGNNPFAVHITAVSCGMLFLIFFYLWMKDIFDETRAMKITLFTAFIPVIFLGTNIAGPDNPLWIFWILCLWFVCKAVKNEKSGDWYLSGIFAGLAALSKYMGFFLPVMILLYLICSKEHRKWLARKEPYLAFGIMFLIFSPVILWNMNHEWASFLFQFKVRHRILFSLKHLLLFAGAQALYMSPIAFCYFIAGFFKLAREGYKNNRWEYKFLFFTSFPLFLFFALNSAFISKIIPHWPSLGYFGAIASIFLVIRRNLFNKIMLWTNMAVSLLITGIVIGQCVYPIMPLSAKLSEKDFSNDLYGWNNLKAEINPVISSLPQDIFLLAERYQTGSQLAFALNREVYVKKQGRTTGFDFWQDINSRTGKNALYFTTSRYFCQPQDIYNFDSVNLIKEIPVIRAGRNVRTFYFYYCTNFQGLK